MDPNPYPDPFEMHDPDRESGSTVLGTGNAVHGTIVDPGTISRSDPHHRKKSEPLFIT